MSWWTTAPPASCLICAHHSAPLHAVEQLSAAAPDTPIIVLSDDGDEDSGVAALRAGAQDYLLKSELNASLLGRAVRYSVERKRAEVVLAQRALHDPLTALPNRALFVDRVRVALDRSRRTESPVVVLFLDVDGFKEINDTLGHSAGDRLLTVLAERFSGLLRPMDTVARFGGDEFTFLLEGLESENEAAIVAQRISRSAGLPVTLGDPERSISVSIGVTIVTDPEAAIDDVIRHADTAMYRAKEFGGAVASSCSTALPAGCRRARAPSWRGRCARPWRVPSSGSTTSPGCRSTARPGSSASRRWFVGSIRSAA